MCRLLWFIQILLIPSLLLGDWLFMAEHASHWCRWRLFVLRDQPSLGRRFYLALCLSDRNFVAAVCLRVYRGDWGVVSLNPYRKHGSIQLFFFLQPFLLSPTVYHTSWISATNPCDDCCGNWVSILLGRVVRQLFARGGPEGRCTEPRRDSHETQTLHLFTCKYHIRGEPD